MRWSHAVPDVDVDPRDLIETIRQGLVVLDSDLNIRFVNRSFCDKFAVAPEDVVGLKLYELGTGAWDVPELRIALAAIIAGGRPFEAFEVDRIFPSIGRRALMLNARKVSRPDDKVQILLAVEDVTGREQVIAVGMQELTHRVKNSLQIIASMVNIEARSHKSGQGKAALERVSLRISALGQLYSKLSKSNTIEVVDAAVYLEELCRDLIAIVHQEGGTSIALETDIDNEFLTTERAIPIGLIVNELVTNAVKYGFPNETGGTVRVTL